MMDSLKKVGGFVRNVAVIGVQKDIGRMEMKVGKLTEEEVFIKKPGVEPGADSVDITILVCECLKRKDIGPLRRLRRDIFSEESLRVVDWVIRFEKRHDEVPTTKLLEEKFEWFSYTEWYEEESLSVLLEKTETRIVEEQKTRLLRKLESAASRKNWKVFSNLLGRLSSLDASSISPLEDKWLKGEDFMEDPNIEWVIRGIRPGGSWGMDFGPSETFKTFINLGQGISVATGAEWGDRKTKYGCVLYWSGEGGNSIRKRVRGLVKYLDLDTVPETFRLNLSPLNLYADPGAINTFVKAGRDAEEETGVPVRLIVIDTLARSSAGADENSAKDFGIYLQAIEVLLREFPEAYVSIISHVSKTGTKSMPRGHTRQLNDADAAIQYKGGKDTGVVVMKCQKMKEAEYFPPITLVAEAVDGTLVVLPSDKRVTKMSKPERKKTLIQLLYDSKEGLVGKELVRRGVELSLVKPGTVEKDIGSLIEEGLVENLTSAPEPAFFTLSPKGMMGVEHE